jgi:hypothetical protein
MEPRTDRPVRRFVIGRRDPNPTQPHPVSMDTVGPPRYIEQPTTAYDAIRNMTNTACFIINFLLAVWLVIITIIFILCHIDLVSDIDKLEDTLENLTNITDGFANCCSELPNNCSCNGIPGLSVLCWDANTNTPTLSSGVPPDTDVLYVVCTPGSTLLDGNNDWESGDYVRYVYEEMAWLQNKAKSTTGIAIDTFSLNWTCSLWPTNPIESSVSMLEVDTNWYIIHVEGIVQNSTTNGTCVITSSDMPSQYMFNNTYPAFDIRSDLTTAQITIGDVITKKAGVAALDSSWTIYYTDALDPFYTNGSGIPIGFYSFDRLYTTDPVEVTPYSPP